MSARNGISIESGQPVEVDSFKPTDVNGVVNLFRTSYGDSYPLKIFYDREGLIQATASGELYCVVGRTPKGHVVGLQSAYRSAPYDRLFEIGAGLVLREYRGAGLPDQMGRRLCDTVIPDSPVEELYGKSFCNRISTQETARDLGFTETAIELALMPGLSEAEESMRIAALLMFRSYAAPNETIFVPEIYEEEFRFMYLGHTTGRTFAPAEKGYPPGEASEIDLTVYEAAGVARITVDEVGGDFEQSLLERESEAKRDNPLVIQARLNLGSPWNAFAVERLRRNGYFLGGVLPRWFGGDGLLMQKVLCEPGFGGARLLTDRARRLLDYIEKDWLLV